MAGTLYDLLEISQSASQETVADAFQRLKDRLSSDKSLSDDDRNNRLIALREAFATLSNPQQRARYDQRLASRYENTTVVIEKESSASWIKWLIIGLIALTGMIAYGKYQAVQEAAKLERERIAAEVKQAELAAKQAEEERRAASEAMRQKQLEANQQRYEIERTRAYADQVSRQAAMQERQAAAEQAQAERQRRYEAERQLAKDKALLRQMQYENSGGGRYRY